MRLFLLALIAAPAGCITPSLLDEKSRTVEVALAELDWRPAQAADLNGLFESASIEGEAAVSLWKIYYHFAADGTFSGAALVFGEAQPQFQTLSGSWKLDGNGLDLGDGQLVQAFAASGQLKLESDGGIAILRRVATQ